jgi:cation/acetate symporter
VARALGIKEDTIGICSWASRSFIYALIGWLSRTMQVDAYYVAGRQVPPVFNGMATAADWMSGASFVAMAGGVYMAGHAYLAYVVGWTGGYVLVAVLMAPYLRKFGCYTVPDFIGTRYGGNTARLLRRARAGGGVVHLRDGADQRHGTIASRALLIPFEVGVWFGLLGILLCSMLGGMRAVTWTQVAQYIVLIIAYLVPVIWMSNKQGFGASRSSSTATRCSASPSSSSSTRSACSSRRSRFPGMSALTTLHAHRGRLGDGGLEVRHAGGLHDDRHRVAAAHPDALLHHAVGEGRAHLGGLVAVLHLPALLHGAGARDLHQAAGARSRTSPPA